MSPLSIDRVRPNPILFVLRDYAVPGIGGKAFNTRA